MAMSAVYSDTWTSHCASDASPSLPLLVGAALARDRLFNFFRSSYADIIHKCAVIGPSLRSNTLPRAHSTWTSMRPGLLRAEAFPLSTLTDGAVIGSPAFKAFALSLSDRPIVRQRDRYEASSFSSPLPSAATTPVASATAVVRFAGRVESGSKTPSSVSLPFSCPRGGRRPSCKQEGAVAPTGNTSEGQRRLMAAPSCR